jgi:5-methylcytosine rRNA methyltransferase NSUN4
MTNLQKMADCYRDQYKEETDNLFQALTQFREKLAIINPFIDIKDIRSITNLGQAINIFGQTFFQLPNVKPIFIRGLMSHYFIDRSSIIPPILLPIKTGMHVLDMCSAPGGKLLVMINRMIEQVSFFANELSLTRFIRLKRVLKQYLPASFLNNSVFMSNKNANWFGLITKNQFDAILLDVPCSSEAHVINDQNLLKNFKKISKSLPIRQYALACSALLALKPGGYLMYATCSINQHENEGVIEKILRKKSSMCEIVSLNTPYGNIGPLGVSILPHKHNAGPAFFSLIRKI